MNQADILIIDDLPNNLRLLANVLEDEGYKVRKLTNGKRGIQAAEATPPDLILLDIMMPEMNGYEVAKYLKKSDQLQHIPIIFLSALNETIDKVMAFNLGGADYITKPFQAEEVLARVRNQLTITQQKKQLEQQNLQLQKEIEERKKVEAALRVYIHAVSHDLRNPVAGMVMVLNSILEENSTLQSGEIPISKLTIERMENSCDRQLKLINSLVETSDNSLTTLQLNCESINLNQFIQKISLEWQPILDKNKVNLTQQMALELPNIAADTNQLWRVYDNLISNAIKYNPPGITLTLSAEMVHSNSQPPQWIKCQVADNGVGIDPTEATRLFELYQRGEKVGKIKGLGLGLYLCRQIILAHGGEIGVQTQLNQGACFWFTLPISTAK
ncbi:MAG: hybrid sensor histidine kinase/response regulator [Microcoleaceae cyanobacterium]